VDALEKRKLELKIMAFGKLLVGWLARAGALQCART
jgi:hypothetical protein